MKEIQREQNLKQYRANWWPTIKPLTIWVKQKKHVVLSKQEDRGTQVQQIFGSRAGRTQVIGMK